MTIIEYQISTEGKCISCEFYQPTHPGEWLSGKCSNPWNKIKHSSRRYNSKACTLYMRHSIYPIEVCCPHCHEVVALIERPIPGPELVRRMDTYLDGLITGFIVLDECPLCKSRLMSGWITRIMETQKKHNA